MAELRSEQIRQGLSGIAADRVHGAGYLARKALGVLLLASPDERRELAAHLARLRPELPAIAAAVEEAVAEGDVRRVIRRADAERRRVALAAARRLRRRRVATISNSSLVARALVYASPLRAEVVVSSDDDEGHLLVADLRAAGIDSFAVSFDEMTSDLAVVGCDAVFADGTFVNRVGTRRLTEALPTLVLVDRWKRFDRPAPPGWPHPELLELVPGESVQAPA